MCLQPLYGMANLFDGVKLKATLNKSTHKKENAFLTLAYNDDVVIGGGIVLLNGDQDSIPWAYTVAVYNKLAPNMLLYWAVLRESIRHGALSVQRLTKGRTTSKSNGEPIL
jgi:lipid II:glycine glycyltransferase (peptidoglycan interpeptide bridge formation enzyme)